MFTLGAYKSTPDLSVRFGDNLVGLKFPGHYHDLRMTPASRQQHP